MHFYGAFSRKTATAIISSIIVIKVIHLLGELLSIMNLIDDLILTKISIMNLIDGLLLTNQRWFWRIHTIIDIVSSICKVVKHFATKIL